MILSRKTENNEPALYESLLKSGLIGDVAFTGELKSPELKEEEGVLRKISQLPAKAYAGADNIAKIAAYKIFRAEGFSHQEAIQRAYDAFQNYSTVGKTWDLTSKIPALVLHLSNSKQTYKG